MHRSQQTRAAVPTADKGAQCARPDSARGATQTDLVSFSCVETQTDATFPETEVDTLKTGVCCVTCRKFFAWKGSADRHHRLHHGLITRGKLKEPYYCPYCEFSSRVRKFVQDHERTHTREAHQFSPQCYLEQTSLDAHVNRQANEENPDACSSREADHKTVHTGDKPYACSACPKQFARKDYLVLHRRVHTGDKPYACSVCPKRFARKSYLIPHGRVHTGEKPYACRFCSRRYFKKLSCDKHERSHTDKDKTPYVCRFCPRRYAWKSYRDQHEAVHTKVKKHHVCDVCNRHFMNKHNLVTHQRVHGEPVGKKRYSCGTCQRSFTIAECLIDHEKTAHTDENTYACITCHEVFSNKAGLIKHDCSLITSRMFAASSALHSVL